jgi:hypothetical protein
MERLSLWLLPLFVSIALAVPAVASDHSIATLWEAASGDSPDEIAPIPWNAFDSQVPEDPVLAGGILTLETSTDSASMG